MTAPEPRVLVLDRDGELAGRLRHHVTAPGSIVKRCVDITRAEAELAAGAWDVVVAGPSHMHRSGLRRLGSLHQRYPWVALVLALHERPRVDLAEIIQVGATDVAPLHIDDGDLRRTLERATRITRRRLQGSSPASDQGRIVMVSSASGGCGKTFLATNAASFLARRTEQPVVLFDLDLQFGEVSTALRLRPDLTITDALHAEAEGHDLDQILDEYLLPHPDGFKVLAAPRLPAEADSVTPGDITRILDVLRARGAWVVVDTHEGLSDLCVPVVEAVDHVFAVATPDRPSLVNLGRYLATLERLGVGAAQVSIVVNKLETDGGLDPVDMAADLGRRFAALIPYSRDVARSLNVGVPLVAGRPKARITNLLTGALSDMLPGNQKVEAAPVAPLPVAEPEPEISAATPPEIPAATPPALPQPSPEAAPPLPSAEDRPPSADEESRPEPDLRQPVSRRCPSTRPARPIRRCRPQVERAIGVPCLGRAPPRGAGPPGPGPPASGGRGDAFTEMRLPPAAVASGPRSAGQPIGPTRPRH